MKSGRGKRVALASAALGIAVIVVAALTSWRWIAETWWISKLSPPVREEQLAEAVGKLANLRSRRAIPVLIKFYVQGSISHWKLEDYLLRLGFPGGVSGLGIELDSEEGKGNGEEEQAQLAIAHSLDDPDPAVRLGVLKFLDEYFRPLPAVVLKKVETNLRAGNPLEERFHAAHILVNCGSDGSAVHRAILHVLREGERNLRGEAIELLRTAVGRAGYAVSALTVALADPDQEWRVKAIEALESLGSRCGSAGPTLLKVALGDPAPEVRLAAQNALYIILLNHEVRDDPVTGLGEAVPGLINALKGPGFSNQLWAVNMLGKIGPEAKAAVPALLDLVKGEFEDRLSVLQALGSIGIGPEAERPLLEILKNQDEADEARQLAATALAGADPNNDQVASALVEVLKNGPGSFFRARAALALGRLRRVEAVPVLRKCLGDEDIYFRSESARALGEMGPAAREAVPDLSRMLNDEVEYARFHAAWALWRITGDAKLSIPVIRKLFPRTIVSNENFSTVQLMVDLGAGDEVNPEARCFHLNEPDSSRDAAAVLAKIGKAAVPALIETLRAEDWFPRSRAARVLGQIGPDAREAIPLLEALAGDGDLDDEVSRAATEALAKIRGRIVMKSGNGKRAALASAALVMIVVVLGTVASWSWIVETWWIHKLGVARSLVRQVDAARRLGDLQSRRAIPKLVEIYSSGKDDHQEFIPILVRIGPEAVAALLIVDPEPKGLRREEILNASGALAAYLESPDPIKRLGALRAFNAFLPPELRSFIGRMKTALEKETFLPARLAAAGILARHRPSLKAVRLAIEDGLKSSDDSLRSEAIRVLRNMGPGADCLFPELSPIIPFIWKAAVGDPSPTVEVNARCFLQETMPFQGNQDPVSPEVLALIPDLIRLLKARNSVDHDWAFGMIHRIGPRARAAVPALIAFARQQSPAVRNEVRESLVAIGEPPGEVAHRGRTEEIPVLKLALKEEDPYSRAEAARALGEMGPRANEAISDLARLLRKVGEFDHVRFRVALALWKIAGSARADPEPLICFVDRWSYSSPRGALEAIQALGEMGSSAAVAVPALIRSLGRSVSSPSSAAALARIGEASIPFLIESLKEEDDLFLQSRAARVLGEIGPPARAGIPLLESLALNGDLDGEVRQAAAEALVKIRR